MDCKNTGESSASSFFFWCRAPEIGAKSAGIGASVFFAFAVRGVVNGAEIADKAQVTKYAILLGVTVLSQFFLRILINGLSERITAELEMSIKSHLFNKIIDKDYGSINKYHSGELMTRLSSDVSIVADGITSIVPSTVSALSRLIGAVIALNSNNTYKTPEIKAPATFDAQFAKLEDVDVSDAVYMYNPYITSKEDADNAIARIKDIVAEPEVGQIYKGTVSGMKDFGLFVKIMNGFEAMVHISEITGERIAKIEDTKIKEGDTVYVRFLGADKRGKTRMSMVGIDQKTGEEIKK